MMLSVGTPRRVRFRAICSAFRIEIFEKFCTAAKKSREIAPKFALCDDAQPRHDP